MCRKFCIKRMLLVIVLVTALIGVQVMQVVANTANDAVQVTTWEELQTAMEGAADGDVILIMDEITVPVGETLGSADKCVTLQKGNSKGRFIFEWSAAPDPVAQVQNIVFDGSEIIYANAYITLYSSAEFHNSTFTNCYSNYDSGAVNVAGSGTTFNQCSFIHNMGNDGGHISTSGELVLNDCTLKDGKASVRGGAIAVGGYEAKLNISGCVITNNSATYEGGGLASPNWGIVTIQNTKIYGNHAEKGEDILERGTFQMNTELDHLQELYADENINVTGWDISSTEEGDDEIFYMQLVYEVKEETPPTEEPSEEPTEQPSEEPSEEVPPTDTPAEEPTEQPSTEEPADTPPATEEPTDSPTENPPTEQPNNTEKPSEQPQNPTNTVTNTDNSSSSVDNSNSSVDSSTSSTVVNTDESQHNDNSVSSNTDDHSDNSTTNTDSHNDSSNTSTTNTTTNDNSKVDRSSTSTTDSHNRSSVRNYYTTTSTYTEQGQQSKTAKVNQPDQVQEDTVQGDVGLVEQDAKTAQAGVPESSASPMQNINIDAKGVDCSFSCIDGVYNISINAHDGADQENVPVKTSTGVNWLDVIQIVLLGAIVLCLIWQPKRTRQGNVQE